MNDIQNKELQPLMVSIKCLAYNHEKYIRKTLEGFVMQKTNFRFEAIVHDDASTDGTAAIIREYAEKYPDIIKPIYETENQYSKKDGSLTKIMHNACKGKYIAYCEGDDYWTDPYKLQKQVDFLEVHSDYVMCSHRYYSFIQEKNELDTTVLPKLSNELEGITYNLEDYIKGVWYTHPLSVIYRNEALNLERLFRYKYKIDKILYYEILKSGKGYLLPDIMAVYRIHNNGVWSGISTDNQALLMCNLRLDAYRVNKSYESAVMLFEIFACNINRLFFIKHLWLTLHILIITVAQLGFVANVKFLFRRFFLNKILNPFEDEIFSIKRECVKDND